MSRLSSILEVQFPVSQMVTVVVLLLSILARFWRTERITEGRMRCEEYIDLAMGAVPMGTWEWNIESGEIHYSDNLWKMFGLRPGSLPLSLPLNFETFRKVLHPDDQRRVLQAIEASLQNGTPYHLEVRLLASDGSVRWALTHGQVVRNNSGKVVRIVGVDIDITERKLAEEKVKKSYAEIERLNERLQAENEYLKAESILTETHGEILGQSSQMKMVVHQAEQVAPTPSSVLIQGETGTGKELIARLIHRLSARKNHVMVIVNCAALPATLVESELFGRERGAYTGALTRQPGRFEVADGSTIFLDEVGELSLDIQAKLLRVLQEGQFQRLGSTRVLTADVRVIAATNHDLGQEVRKGRFREDLFYRLNVFPIKLPPLRERPEDIPILTWAFVEEFSVRMGKKITRVSRKTMDALQRYSWPGNVRELRNLIEYSVIISRNETLRPPPLQGLDKTASASMTLDEVGREHILRTLGATNWRIKGANGAAERLGLKPSTLYTRMAKLGIPTRHQRDEAA